MTDYSISISPVIGLGFTGQDVVVTDNYEHPIGKLIIRSIIIGFIVITFKSIEEL